MSTSAYLTLKGQKQGSINGSVTLKGHENSILVQGFVNEIVSPRDLQSGLPTGRAMHKPISVVKEVDHSSPGLWNALVNNENLVAWQLRFYRPNPDATERLVYTIDLTNANVASIREYLSESASAGLELRQEVTFTYQKIAWTWAEGSVTAQDDWAAPAR